MIDRIGSIALTIYLIIHKIRRVDFLLPPIQDHETIPRIVDTFYEYFVMCVTRNFIYLGKAWNESDIIYKNYQIFYTNT